MSTNRTRDHGLPFTATERFAVLVVPFLVALAMFAIVYTWLARAETTPGRDRFGDIPQSAGNYAAER
jgi:hypothetical protein